MRSKAVMFTIYVFCCCARSCFGIPKYFAFYDDIPAETMSFTNLRLSVSASESVFTKALGLDSLLLVEDIFFSTSNRGMNPNWEQEWHDFLPQAKALISNQSIIGFNLGDELVNNCIPLDNVTSAANAVRKQFPRRSGPPPRGEHAIIWYNEAAGPVRLNISDKCGQKSTGPFVIPRALDWFSIDKYHMNGQTENWVNKNVKAFYEQYIYPRLSGNQRVVLVPGSFGSNVNHFPNGTYVCDKDCYDRMCSYDANDFYTWAKDPASKVEVIAPWNWSGCKSCNGSHWTPPHTCCMDEIGTKDQPKSREVWERIGSEIKQMRSV